MKATKDKGGMAVRLSFYGAAHEVTGSCYYLEACGKKILIDCGLQQGRDEKENQSFPFITTEIDMVLLTHAHIDHSGRLPLLAALGFSGKIYATGATCDLCSIMLRDSAHIQEQESQWQSRKSKRANADMQPPLYTIKDAEQILQHFFPCTYQNIMEIAPGISIRFIDIGHLLGSAAIEIWLEENGVKKKLVFSGDIGNLNQPLVKDPELISEADYVITESTYGDRNHEIQGDYTKSLAQIIESTLAKGGNVVIPSFAVGRTQELLYFIREIYEQHLIKTTPSFPVYVDSPLAIEATNIYREDYSGYYDSEAMALLRRGIHPLSFPNLHTSVTAEESKAINSSDVPCVIIASSGMCEAGRVRHHLKHNLWRAKSTILFVGYQAQGTLGRILKDGAKKVKLFGEEIAVKANIDTFTGISAHADKNGIMRWLHGFTKKPTRVFVVHGEETVVDEFTAFLGQEGFTASAANYKGTFDLARDEWIQMGISAAELEKITEKTKGSAVYMRLYAAGKRLLEVVEQNRNGANKDLAKLADQINALSDKWG